MQSTKVGITIFATLVVAGMLLSFLVVVSGGVFSAPQVTRISPTPNAENVGLSTAVIIEFDKPLKRREVRASLSPAVHGEWKFQAPLLKITYSEHLYLFPPLRLRQIQHIR